MRTPKNPAVKCLPSTTDAYPRASYLSIKLARAVAPEKTQERIDSILYIITYTHNKSVARSVVAAQMRLAVRAKELLSTDVISRYSGISTHKLESFNNF